MDEATREQLHVVGVCCYLVASATSFGVFSDPHLRVNNRPNFILNQNYPCGVMEAAVAGAEPDGTSSGIGTTTNSAVCSG